VCGCLLAKSPRQVPGAFCCPAAVSLDEAKTGFRAEYEAWKGNRAEWHRLSLWTAKPCFSFPSGEAPVHLVGEAWGFSFGAASALPRPVSWNRFDLSGLYIRRHDRGKSN